MRGPCKGSCGLEFLRDNTERQQSSASDAKRVVDTFCSAGALDMRGLVTDSTLVLSARACEARIVFVENLRKTHCQHSRIDTSHGKHDEQLDISSDELLQRWQPTTPAPRAPLSFRFGFCDSNSSDGGVNRIAIRRVVQWLYLTYYRLTSL